MKCHPIQFFVMVVVGVLLIQLALFYITHYSSEWQSEIAGARPQGDSRRFSSQHQPNKHLDMPVFRSDFLRNLHSVERHSDRDSQQNDNDVKAAKSNSVACDDAETALLLAKHVDVWLQVNDSIDGPVPRRLRKDCESYVPFLGEFGALETVYTKHPSTFEPVSGETKSRAINESEKATIQRVLRSPTMRAYLPLNDPFQRKETRPYKSCAVVGNSGILLGAGKQRRRVREHCSLSLT
jgi:hypothetical protein